MFAGALKFTLALLLDMYVYIVRHLYLSFISLYCFSHSYSTLNYFSRCNKYPSSFTQKTAEDCWIRFIGYFVGGRGYIELCGSITTLWSIPASLLNDMAARQTSAIQRYGWTVIRDGGFWEGESFEGLLQRYV